MDNYILWLDQISVEYIERVGGKNAFVGEMITYLTGVDVKLTKGFATTTNAYRWFLVLYSLLGRINAKSKVLDVGELNRQTKIGTEIRSWVIDTPFQYRLDEAIETGLTQNVT